MSNATQHGLLVTPLEAGFDPNSDESLIYEAMLEIYAGAISGDRTRSDAHIAEDSTLWDAHAMPLVHGREELDAVRDTRPSPSTPKLDREFSTRLPEVTVWGDIGLLLHYLSFRPANGGAPHRIRNSSVWQRRNGAWLMVHNHEDVMHRPFWPDDACDPNGH